jgi:hypothetical protein
MSNENGDDFSGVRVKLADGTEVGRLHNIRHVDRTNSMQRIHELNYGGGFVDGKHSSHVDGALVDLVSKIVVAANKQYEDRIRQITSGPVSDCLSNRYKMSVDFGPSPLLAIIRDLIYMDLLKRANALTFLDRHGEFLTDQEREDFMEKYGVQTDPKKVADAKKKAPGEKTAGVDDPNVNVPKDPDRGTEPFEKKPEGG